MKFLIIGNSVEETVIRSETGLHRVHIGGVGAIMARELALSAPDAEVTFLTAAAPGRPTANITLGMTKNGVRNVHTPRGHRPQTRRAQARITTVAGNPVSAKGDWPPMPSISPDIPGLAAEHDWTLITANLAQQDLKMAAAYSNNLAINATTKNHAKRIPAVESPSIVTMNRSEATELAASLRTHIGLDLKEATHARTLMITMAAKGRILYHLDDEPLHSPAPQPPAGTDFIGAGDAATAGLVYAIAHHLDIDATINQFILNILHRNALAYRSPAPNPA